jgi:hypothetical protein
MRVGGPHGRGTLLRPCELCNPARLRTQIPGVVQPLSMGSTLCLLLPAQRGGCEPVVPRAVAWHKNPVPSTVSVLVPFTFQSQLWFGVPVRVPTAVRRSLLPWDWWVCLYGDHMVGGWGRLFLSPPMTVRSEGSFVPRG